jgi:phage repressor protein C with HTH and peptisase S24 domain/DNA-binding XRE family transcriptional regulator
MLNLANELKKIRAATGLSQQKFADLIGIPQRTWSNYESGQTTPKMGVLWGLAAKGYPIKGLTTPPGEDLVEAGKITREELRGRYETALSEARKADPKTPIDDAWAERVNSAYTSREHPSNANSLPIYQSSTMPEGSFVIPLLDQALSAGLGAALPEGDEAKALIPVPAYLSRYGKDLAALTVEGDSMEPSLHRGDMVVCDSHGWSGEGIYAVRIGGSGFVKRLTKAPGKVVVLSDNPKYPPREEPEGSEDFAIIGRVHCAITKVE